MAEVIFNTFLNAEMDVPSDRKENCFYSLWSVPNPSHIIPELPTVFVEFLNGEIKTFESVICRRLIWGFLHHKEKTQIIHSLSLLHQREVE